MKFSTVLQYEPELFPGLIYRMKQPKIVLLIFVSGKIVLTGAKVSSHFLYMLISLHSLFFFLHFILCFTGERGDVHCLWKHLSCTDRVPKSSAMVCSSFLLCLFKSILHCRRLLLEVRFSCYVDKILAIIWILAVHYVLLGTCGLGLGTGDFYC